jgi:hypothetical protein
MKGSLIASIGSVCIFMSAVRPSSNFVLLLTTVVVPLIQEIELILSWILIYLSIIIYY